MTTITREILDLLQLEHETFSHIPPGDEPPLEEQLRFYQAKRDLFRRAGENTLDMDEAKDAVEAYGEADRMTTQLSLRIARDREASPGPGCPSAGQL